MIKNIIRTYVALCAGIIGFSCASLSQAAVITFEASDFSIDTTFSNVSTFSFSIDIAGPLAAGVTYSNPTLNAVNYSVFGSLDATPSGFPAFNLVRSIGGSEFYAQGSSLEFSIAASADLSDGLQVADLLGGGSAPAFVFDGREVDTGRYHPALVELYTNGTGQIQNSNNTGGVNPGSNQVVDVDFGDEYISGLTFDAATLTLAAQPVPLPGG